jgi:O-antigen/teichoic acid export membrane protein
MPLEAPKPGPRVDVRKTLTRNTAWNYTGFAVNLLTNLFLFPYVVHEIGDAAAGIWLLLGSVTGYMGLLELGLVPALAQSVAVYRSRGDTAG